LASDSTNARSRRNLNETLIRSTAEAYVDWLKKYQNATPDFTPGDTLTEKDILKLLAFMPPGFYEVLNFPGLHVWRLLRQRI
jgi:hypothetical protein